MQVVRDLNLYAILHLTLHFCSFQPSKAYRTSPFTQSPPYPFHSPAPMPQNLTPPLTHSNPLHLRNAAVHHSDVASPRESGNPY